MANRPKRYEGYNDLFNNLFTYRHIRRNGTCRSSGRWKDIFLNWRLCYEDCESYAAEGIDVGRELSLHACFHFVLCLYIICNSEKCLTKQDYKAQTTEKVR